MDTAIGIKNCACLLCSRIKGAKPAIVVIDVKKKKLFGGYDIYTHNGTKKSKWNLFDFIAKLEEIATKLKRGENS